MTESKVSQTPRSEHRAMFGLSTLVAAGAAFGAAGTHAYGSVIYSTVDATIDSAGLSGPASTTINVPAGASYEAGYPLYTFSASTTNGLTFIKPTGQLSGENTSSAGTDVAVLSASANPLVANAFAPGAFINKYTGSGGTGYFSPSIPLHGADNSPGLGSALVDNFQLLNGSTGQFTVADGIQYIGFDLSPNNSNVYDGYVAIEPLTDSSSDVSAEILGVGIETTPNLGINAGSQVSVPEPTSLGLLAMGSVGLLAYRRRRTA